MPVERALGWDIQRDHFTFTIKQRKPAHTRRQLLSIIASLFDPLGFLAPFVVRAKILLQKVWQLGLAWDDPLPLDLLAEWQMWESEMLMLMEFSIPRFYRMVDMYPEEIQVHIFGDARELAFCAVGYLRFEYHDGSRKCVFVIAKTCVAPTKKLSIPRLQLQAAVLCVRLASITEKEHDYNFSSMHFWSDSTTVLHWIRGASTRHVSFIANRLSEILDTTESTQWHYCPTKLNPADNGTRGLPVSSITLDSKWLNGPDFLQLGESEWPVDITTKVTDSCPLQPTTEGGIYFSGKTTSQRESAQLVDLTRYSSYSRAVSVMVYIERFLHNCKSPMSDRMFGSPSVAERIRAKISLVCREQAKAFGVELEELKGGLPVKKQSKLVSLSPFLDEDEIICVGGRIGKADISFVAHHPIVLDSSSELTKLIVLDTHQGLGHAGVDNIQNELRQQYWILRCKATVKKVLHGCWLCKLRRAVPRPPKMAELPHDRLLVSPPFTKAGVDYFGPLEVKYGRKHLKRWICFFTCLVTRGVHLEVRSCKRTFKSVLNNQILSDEVLATTMVEVESLINSRPLTEVSSDVDSMEAITPNHFLLGHPSLNLSPGVFVDKEISS